MGGRLRFTARLYNDPHALAYYIYPMASPIILCFDRTGSFSSINNISFGVGGGAWGSLTLPFTSLLFTPDRFTKALGEQSNYLGDRPPNNQIIYDKFYLNAPLAHQRYFWGETNPIPKQACGIVIGLDGGKAISGAVSAYNKAIRLIPSKVYKTIEWVSPKAAKATSEMLAKISPREIIIQKITDLIQKTGVSIDKLTFKTEGSLNATLYGMNGHHTYDLDARQFSSYSNVIYINITIAAIAQVALNFVLIGNFPPFPIDATFNLNIVTWMMHIYGVFDEAFAWTIIADGAVGFIPPGAAISIIGSC